MIIAPLLYLINQTPGRSLVRALRARTDILLLINQRIFPLGSDVKIMNLCGHKPDITQRHRMNAR